jgi:hypothetical protein
LSAAIDDSATSLTVVSDEGFPPVDGFTVRLDNELLRVIDGAGTTTWTVERGADLSTAVGHAADTPLVLQQTIGLGQAVLADSTPRLGSRLPTDLTLLTGKDFHTWVPLTTPITSEPGVTRIVGFGWVTTWTVDSINAMTVNTQPGGIAWQNASAVPAVTWPDLSVDAFQELFDAHAGVDEPLLAPVLVR